jgi:hypothetical protein
MRPRSARCGDVAARRFSWHAEERLKGQTLVFRSLRIILSQASVSE